MHTGKNVRGLAALLALCSLAVTAKAQTMRVTPGTKLVAGQTATISYSNPSLANQQIVVEVSGGYPIVFTEAVTIQLDASGRGTGTWTVKSGWMTASFNAAAVAEVTLPVRG